MIDNDTVNIDIAVKAVQKKVGDTYEFIRHLGGGEFSNVYLVKHTAAGQEHALKVLDYHYLIRKLTKENRHDPHLKIEEIKRRFITEAMLYKRIQHPNIVKIHETGVVEDESRCIEIPYMVMSYIKGLSLSDLLRNQAPFERDRVLAISRDVLGALEVIHQNNIIHRDIKPANLMIEEKTGAAIIIDFGIAKEIVAGTRLTTTGSLLGSPVYMAPEQFIDSSKVDKTVDIYSFGIVLYEMLTGEAPFSGGSFAEIMNAHLERPIPNAAKKYPGLSEKIADILSKTMAKNPRHRYQHPKDLLKALENALSASPTPGADETNAANGRRKYSLYIYLAAFIVLAAALGFFLILPGGDNEKEKKEIPPITSITTGTTGTKTPTGKTPPSTDTTGKQTLEIPGILEIKAQVETLKQFLSSDADPKEKIAQCQAFLNKYPPARVPGDSEAGAMIREINDRMTQLKKELETDTLYGEHTRTIKKYLENYRFDDAAKELEKARDLKETDEIKALSIEIETKKTEYETRNGTSDFNLLKDQIDLAQFLSFRKKYPDSLHLQDLIERLKKADTHLPPENYWTDTLQKNPKGYYEIAFDENHNRHRMVYIPGRKIWFDKYEVSNRQLREYLVREKTAAATSPASKIFREGDEYPAVVSYDQAEKYCQRYGFRLPTQEEWEYAAGRGMHTYPWGNEVPGEKGVWQANGDSLGDEGQEEKDGHAGTAPVKSFEAFSSPRGLVNMAGNVWEWVQGRILKGGSFLSGPEDLMIKSTIPGGSKDLQGFRCVKDEKNLENRETGGLQKNE